MKTVKGAAQSYEVESSLKVGAVHSLCDGRLGTPGYCAETTFWKSVRPMRSLAVAAAGRGLQEAQRGEAGRGLPCGRPEGHLQGLGEAQALMPGGAHLSMLRVSRPNTPARRSVEMPQRTQLSHHRVDSLHGIWKEALLSAALARPGATADDLGGRGCRC